MSTMRFGKYKGTPMAEIPEDYLLFLIETSGKTIRECQSELDRRNVASTWLEKIVVVGYKELAKQNHPDIGGRGSVMRDINLAAETLKQLVRAHILDGR